MTYGDVTYILNIERNMHSEAPYDIRDEDMRQRIVSYRKSTQGTVLYLMTHRMIYHVRASDSCLLDIVPYTTSSVRGEIYIVIVMIRERSVR
jgi:hypothetical protein